jgi:hypothetical protein
LGVFFPKDVDLVEVVNSLWGDYNFTVEIEWGLLKLRRVGKFKIFQPA